ncbi:MAG TPA: NAD-dependent epimerase/dehydratase family protein [Patescibacteria group bacterium]|nr:NAD-dependent epimerase/dehydratase family protein [Patescibacteria group bacterium]
MDKKASPKRALITGGAGFIGSHLCEELLSRGFKVTAVDNLSTSRRSNLSAVIKNKNFRFYKGSILDEKLMRRLVRNCDIVYHMAAAVGVKYILSNPLGSIITNIKGTEIVLELADKYHKKVILASTSEVYGKHACEPFKEEDDRILGPVNKSRWSYAEAKAMDEFLALAYVKERKLAVVIVRFFNTVGPRQTGRYGMVLPGFILNALENKPITVYGTGEQMRSFTFVKDAVNAVVELSLKKQAEGQVFNVGGGANITIKDLAEKVKQRAFSSSRIVFIPYEQAYKGKAEDFEDMVCRIPDICKLQKMIGFKPGFSMDQIVDLTIEYFRKVKKCGLTGCLR